MSQKRPTTISLQETKNILKNAGYESRVGGKHPTVWNHPDPNRPRFVLSHHSGDLSPAISRKIWSLKRI